METCKQPNDYFTIEYGFDADVIISAFYSSVPEEMENPENIKKFDCVLIATNHKAFDYEMIKSHVQLIVDTRGVYKESFDELVRAQIWWYFKNWIENYFTITNEIQSRNSFHLIFNQGLDNFRGIIS